MSDHPKPEPTDPAAQPKSEPSAAAIIWCAATFGDAYSSTEEGQPAFWTDVEQAYDAGVAAERERHVKLVAAARELAEADGAIRRISASVTDPYAWALGARERNDRLDAALAALRALLAEEEKP